MRLLADENFPLPAIEALRHAAHDCTWARTDHPGAKDAALPELAESDGRVLVTLDKDFRQIAIQRRQRLEQSGVILFRVHPAVPDTITPLVLRTLEMDQQWEGYATMVTEDRVLTVRSGRPETP
jgi:predicted nuclease of predicted toxin-antitoxin system